MKRCALLGLTLGLLSCQTPGSLESQASGQFAVRLLWPEAAFRVQVIPADTETLHLKVFNGSQIELDEVLSRQQSGELLRYTLQVGTKTVEVQALSATGETLAESRSELTIQANQLTRATIDLVPVSPAAPPAGNNGSGTGGAETPDAEPSTPPVEGSGTVIDAPENPTETEPTPQDSAEPQPSASPSTQTGSRSGGSGSSSASTTPTLNNLETDPTTLPGDGFVARLKASVSDPDEVLMASDYAWSCVDNDSNTCDAPRPSAEDPNVAYWTAPDPANTGPYTLTLVLTTGSGTTETQSVTVAVEQGNQNVNSDLVEFEDGGE